MAASGTYTEQLQCGGKLTVTQGSWSIEYYFPGPDLRYNGEFVRIPGSEVADYVVAFEENWAEYERLKTTVPVGGTLEKPGRKSMVIRVGGYWPGVSIRNHHMATTSRKQLEKVLGGYRYALKRAQEIQQFLATV
jgi:hypothetical protein